MPGRTPALPAVGAATIRPIEAFTSSTAIAYCAALCSTSPQMERPLAACCASFFASPPIRPPMDLTGVLSGVSADERMISSALFIRCVTSSRVVSPSWHSRRRMISEMGSCCCVQSASSSDAFLKSIICSPPYGSMIMTSWTLGLFLSGSSMPSGKWPSDSTMV